MLEIMSHLGRHRPHLHEQAMRWLKVDSKQEADRRVKALLERECRSPDNKCEHAYRMVEAARVLADLIEQEA